MLRVGTLARDGEGEAGIVGDLVRDPEIDLVIRCLDRVDALASIRSQAVDCLLAIGLPEWFDFQVLEEARSEGILLVALGEDPIEVERLEVAGFRVLSPTERSGGLGSLLREIEDDRPSPAPADPGAGRLIAVWGPKGSPGRTTVAIELVAALSTPQRDAVVVDADLYGGDVLQKLGVVEELPGIVPLAREAARGAALDPEWSGRLSRAWKGGPALVPGLIRSELWDEVTPFGWRELVGAIRRDFPFGVCDVGFCLEASDRGLGDTGGRNEIARSTLEESDYTIAVFRADAIGLKTFVWAVKEYEDLLASDKVFIVANRVRRDEEAEIRRLIRRYLGRTIFAAIPDVPELAARALWDGTTLFACDPGGAVASEIRRLAAAVGGEIEPRGLLTRMAAAVRR